MDLLDGNLSRTVLHCPYGRFGSDGKQFPDEPDFLGYEPIQRRALLKGSASNGYRIQRGKQFPKWGPRSQVQAQIPGPIHLNGIDTLKWRWSRIGRNSMTAKFLWTGRFFETENPPGGREIHGEVDT